MISEEDWGSAVDVLKRADEIAVCCHVSPDGDAFGSMLGLGLALQRKWKKVWMGWGSDELVVPYSYQFLPGVEQVVPSGRFPDTIDAFVAIDCADVGRLDMLVERYEAAKISINIDHHISNTRFGAINLIDPAFASSAELAYELIRRMGVEVDQSIATCLYTGVVTDTGRFQYSNTTPKTMRTAAELLELGADHLTVAERIYESLSLAQVRITGRVLGRAQIAGGVVHSWLELADLEGAGLEAAEDVIDLLRTVREARITLLLKEQEPGVWRGSLRSRGGGDVAKIAKSFGGGGHAAAAGFTAYGEREQVTVQVLERLADIAP